MINYRSIIFSFINYLLFIFILSNCIYSLDELSCPKYDCNYYIENHNNIDKEKLKLINDNNTEKYQYKTNIKCGEITSNNHIVINPDICHSLNKDIKFNSLYKSYYYYCDVHKLVCQREYINKDSKSYFLNKEIENLNNYDNHFNYDDYVDLTNKIYSKNSIDFLSINYFSTKVLPGEFCNSALSCYNNNICVNNKCNGYQERSLCKSHIDCKNGLYCNKQKYCVPQLEVGESGCNNDFECVNTSGCLGNICTEYYSIENNIFTTSAAFCKSAYEENNICKESYKLYSHSYDEVCNKEKEKCIYKNSKGNTISKDCKCGLTKNGYKFCPLERGDIDFLRVLEYRKKLFKSSYNKLCHTLSRLDYSLCFDVRIDYNNLEFYNFIYENHYLLQSNNKCVKKSILYDLYNYKDLSYNKYISELSYSIIKMSLYSIAIALILLIL